jgi:hypothetical protein
VDYIPKEFDSVRLKPNVYSFYCQYNFVNMTYFWTAKKVFQLWRFWFICVRCTFAVYPCYRSMLPQISKYNSLNTLYLLWALSFAQKIFHFALGENNYLTLRIITSRYPGCCNPVGQFYLPSSLKSFDNDWRCFWWSQFGGCAIDISQVEVRMMINILQDRVELFSQHRVVYSHVWTVVRLGNLLAELDGPVLGSSSVSYHTCAFSLFLCAEDWTQGLTHVMHVFTYVNYELSLDLHTHFFIA